MNNVVRKLTGTNTRWPSAKALAFAPYSKRYMARDMFGTSTVILGSETDDQLFEALKIVLASFGATVKEKNYNVVGSQEISVWEANINSKKIRIYSETYEGLSIKGSTELVNKIQAKVAEQVAI